MEQQRVSASPSAPATTVQRNKAPAPTRPAESVADDPATSGGFLSMLIAQGEGVIEEELPSATTLLANASQPLDVALFPHAAQLPDAPLPAAAVQGAGAALLAWQGADAWQAMPGAVAQGGGLATLSLADAAQRAGLLGAELLGQGGLVAQTAKIDAAVQVPLANGQSSAVAGYQRAFARLQNVLSQGAPAVPGPAAQALGQHQPVGAGRQGALASLIVPTALAAAPEGRQAAAAASHAPLDVAAVPQLSQWLAAEPTARSAAAAVGTEFGSGAGGLSSSAHGARGEPLLDAAPTVAEPSAAGAEDAVTEQASYWVSENLQNAELTVTHDGMPVEVSVSLSGKEAHVAFRSDEIQTRELLDASKDQLRDLLGGEGLVLSGVSVGESGARHASGGGAGSLRGRASGRVGVQMPVSDEATDAIRRPSVLTDRAVDVFV